MYKMTPKLQKQYEELILNMQKKTFQSGGGKPPAMLIESANKNKESLKDEYFQLLSVEIEKIKKLYNALNEDNYKDDLRIIYNLLHEIRGQAGTFDYILLSHVANEACILLTTLFKGGSQKFEVSKHLFGIFFDHCF